MPPSLFFFFFFEHVGLSAHVSFSCSPWSHFSGERRSLCRGCWCDRAEPLIAGIVWLEEGAEKREKVTSSLQKVLICLIVIISGQPWWKYVHAVRALQLLLFFSLFFLPDFIPQQHRRCASLTRSRLLSAGSCGLFWRLFWQRPVLGAAGAASCPTTGDRRRKRAAPSWRRS